MVTDTQPKQVCFTLAELEELETIARDTGLRGRDLQDEYLHRREERVREQNPVTTAYPYDTSIKGLYFSGRAFASIR